MVPLKRRKVGSYPVENTGKNGNTGNTGITGKFAEVFLFLLERKMGSSRRAFLSELARQKGFQVEQLFSENVTHLIAENNSGDEVQTWLRSQPGGRGLTHLQLLDISWFTESMAAGRPVEVLDKHKLQELQKKESHIPMFSVPTFACQRRTTLQNHNMQLTEALTLLAEHAEQSEEDGRCVAFCRAAAVLKFLPSEVTHMKQLRGLPCLGEHSLRVIKDVLEHGASKEVESIKNSERFKALKLLTGIFGVGVKTAERWFRDGICTLHQLQDSGQPLNQVQQAGVVHYDDLNQCITRAEADAIAEIVEEAVLTVLPGAQVTLTGGFRRGKATGHDVDFLITHPEEGREEGLMTNVVSWLDMQGFLLYQKTSKNSYLETQDCPARPASNMDRFERCFSIFRLSTGDKQGPEQPHLGPRPWRQGEDDTAGRRGWRAVRVDLVVSPISQFGFALLGWTGSKLFERELRRWAGQEKSMSLSSHALYDCTQRRYLRAMTEEEIFSHLGLEYVPPSERNA